MKKASQQSITIKECSEHLVDITKLYPHIAIRVEPNRVRDEGGVFLRRRVAKMLDHASRLLPHGVHLAVVDAWRPIEVQARYFRYYELHFRRSHPRWNPSRVRREASKYAVRPGDTRHAGHLTGGAVDVTLTRNRRRLPMKTSWASLQAAARSTYDNLPPHILRNRRLLANVMSAAGFVNYPLEYWHWSWGDSMWAVESGSPTAVFGPIRSATRHQFRRR